MMVIYNAMEQAAGEFKKKSRDSDFHIHNTETFPPWINQSELGVQESKKCVSQKMKRKIPQR